MRPISGGEKKNVNKCSIKTDQKYLGYLETAFQSSNPLNHSICYSEKSGNIKIDACNEFIDGLETNNFIGPIFIDSNFDESFKFWRSKLWKYESHKIFYKKSIFGTFQ